MGFLESSMMSKRYSRTLASWVTPLKFRPEFTKRWRRSSNYDKPHLLHGVLRSDKPAICSWSATVTLCYKMACSVPPCINFCLPRWAYLTQVIFFNDVLRGVPRKVLASLKTSIGIFRNANSKSNTTLTGRPLRGAIHLASLWSVQPLLIQQFYAFWNSCLHSACEWMQWRILKQVASYSGKWFLYRFCKVLS